MGNSQKSSLLKPGPLYEKTEVLSQKTVNDVRYGTNINIIQKRANPSVYYAALTKTVNDSQTWQARVKEIQFRQQLNHQNLVKLENYSSEKHDEFCSSFCKIGQLYEYYSNDLRQETFERRKYQIPYKEAEIWYIIDSLVSVALYLKSNDVTHGDIRPYNVLLDQNGRIKLGEIYSHLQPLSSYSLIFQGISEDFFLSPQCLQGLKGLQEVPQYDRVKNEIFSIGMTALNAASLQDTNKECYDIPNLTINRQGIQKLLQGVSLSHSPALANTIESMLLDNEQQRANLEDIQHTVRQQSQVADSLSIVETLNEQQYQSQQQETPQKLEYSPKNIEIPTQQSPITVTNYQPVEVPPPQTNYYVVSQPKQSYTTTTVVNNYQGDDDLMERIRRVLADSNQVIDQYKTVDHQGNTVNTTNYNVTYTTTYQQQEQQPQYYTQTIVTNPQVQTSTYVVNSPQVQTSTIVTNPQIQTSTIVTNPQVYTSQYVSNQQTYSNIVTNPQITTSFVPNNNYQELQQVVVENQEQVKKSKHSTNDVVVERNPVINGQNYYTVESYASQGLSTQTPQFVSYSYQNVENAPVQTVQSVVNYVNEGDQVDIGKMTEEQRREYIMRIVSNARAAQNNSKTVQI